MAENANDVQPDYNLVMWAMTFFYCHEKAATEIAAYIIQQRALNVPLYRMSFDRWQRLNPWRRRTEAYTRFTKRPISNNVPIPWARLLKNSCNVSYDEAAECFQIFIEEVVKSLCQKNHTDVASLFVLRVHAREPARQTPVKGNKLGGKTAKRREWYIKLREYKSTYYGIQ